MESHVHIVVEGHVQGVGFRWFVSRWAKSLDLRGFVRNLGNGNVEIEAEGDRSILEELIKQVKVGPRSAQVRNLSLEWMEPFKKDAIQRYTNFEIR